MFQMPHVAYNLSQLWTVKFTVQVTIILLLLIAGNINPNLGPTKYPCCTCGKSCRSNQRSIQCDTCDIWTHWKCVSSNIQEYYRLSSSDEEWSCHSCDLPNFTDSFFDNEVTIKNSDKNRECDSSLQLSFSAIQDLLPEISESGNLFHKLKENRSQYKKNLTVSYLNINSLRYKFEEIKQILIEWLVDFSSPVGSLCHTPGVVRRQSYVVHRPSCVVCVHHNYQK